MFLELLRRTTRRFLFDEASCVGSLAAGHRAVGTLHAPTRMRALCARERTRSDRTGDPFSMITITRTRPMEVMRGGN